MQFDTASQNKIKQIQRKNEKSNVSVFLIQGNKNQEYQDHRRQTERHLSFIQSSQVEGLSYGRIKSMKLGKVFKHGDEITIRFNTCLEKNNLGLKKSQIVFSFIDGASPDQKSNDFYEYL